MFLHDNIKVYLVLGATDMRKGINSLSMMISAHTNYNLMDGSMFVFCSKNKKLLKVLYWDKNGFSLFQKKMEKEKFKWPSSSKNIFEMSLRELRWLIDGLHPISTSGFKKIYYESVM